MEIHKPNVYSRTGRQNRCLCNKSEKTRKQTSPWSVMNETAQN